MDDFSKRVCRMDWVLEKERRAREQGKVYCHRCGSTGYPAADGHCASCGYDPNDEDWFGGQYVNS